MPHDTEVEGLIIRPECPVPASRSNKQTNSKFVVHLLVIFAVFLAIIGIAVSMQREKIELALTSLVFSVTTTYTDDDLRTGKSCYYKRQRWHCQDCADSSRNVGACRKLQRKRRCAPFKRSDWDRPARFTSEYNPASTSQMQTRTLSYQGWYKYHGQPLCTVSTCFNLSRCRNDALTVYVNTTGYHALLDFARDASVINITRVYNHQDACLVLVTGDLYSSASEMKEALHWQEDGRNHILWNLSQFPFLPKLTGDGPFSLFHVGHAAIASESLTLAQLRLGYDISLPLRRRWGRTTESVDIHRDRKYLLCFRGSIQNSQHPYYQHRWLAAEYWNDPDVIVDVQCKRIKFMGAKKEVVKPYELPSSSYDDMLWNSTFGFAPGGSGVSSFRNLVHGRNTRGGFWRFCPTAGS
jgi:Exostosin family